MPILNMPEIDNPLKTKGLASALAAHIDSDGMLPGNDLVAAARQRLIQSRQNAQAILQQKLAMQQQRQQAHAIRKYATGLQQNLANQGPTNGSYSPVGPIAMPNGNVRDWIRQAIIESGNRGQHIGRGLYNMIMHESGGNPRATNNWDSNAAAGTPSIGLMQTIQPTFDAYAMKGHKDIYNPVDNIIAGLRYALSRYGVDMVRAGGRHDANGNYIGY